MSTPTAAPARAERAERVAPSRSGTAPGRAASPVATPAAPVPRARRRPKLVALGVLAVCLGGLGAATLWTQATNTVPLVVVTQPVARGEVIEPGDLAVVDLPRAPGVSTVAADQLPGLVGRTAVTDLNAGSLLPSGAIGDPVLPPGQSHLGLRLAAGRIPAEPLPQGVPVSLVPVPGPQDVTAQYAGSQPTGGQSSGSGGPTGTGNLTPIRATIATAPVLAPDGTSWLVDVSVPTDDARQVAELAATDRLALVREAS